MGKFRACSSKPLRMWIDGKCFNLKSYNRKHTEATETIMDTGDSFEVKLTEAGKYSTSFRLPTKYYNRIWSFNDFSIKSFNRETDTELTIPKSGREGEITVTGRNEDIVSRARNELHSIVGELRRCSSPTNFVAIPVHSEEVQQNFSKFKEEVLAAKITGVEDSIFISSTKLHLTIVVSALLDDSERSEAIKALEDCKAEVVDPLISETGPLNIQVAGIDSMNSELKKVHVLYANAKIVHDSDKEILQTLANGINDFFYNRGLAIQYQDTVKLHVTLMNTKYRTNTLERKKRKWTKREPFDATSILEKYKEFHFGESLFDRIHLSYMSSVGEDGFYKPLSIVTITGI